MPAARHRRAVGLPVEAGGHHHIRSRVRSLPPMAACAGIRTVHVDTVLQSDYWTVCLEFMPKTSWATAAHLTRRSPKSAATF
ncbi:hypothetical protein [Hoeflea sp.]|uniref:hypothetical protein n=1 Tax=Hoeflea sp. TaxID=1940281 RepID=UPI003B019ADB